ncbi:hypothetical protein FACS189434_00090 [Bacteroidia bacterium]|nr:hypothetical protein FACS189434_00090 [Bacteroidia bacterium]
MNYFIFRNYTIEPFFKGIEADFSGYEDISFIDSDAYIWFYLPPYRTNNEIIAKEISNYGKLLELVFSKINPNKELIVFTMQSVFNIKYLSSDTEVENAIWAYNQAIKSLSEEKTNVKIIDISDFLSRFPQEQLIDWKYYYLSQMPLNPKLAIYFKDWFKRQLEIIDLQRKKCIVLDLDNTLWGGILGEDGIEGIKIGGSYPGNAYRFFQEYLLELYRIGTILTVCSKNNEADVLEVLEKHPEILLHKEHLAAYRINWNNKAENIKEIASELNIGLDSLVFIDDNPTERELVKQILPSVVVPDFPQQPYNYPDLIKILTDNYFGAYKLTREDKDKTQQYKENADRKQFQNQFIDFESYLKSLEIELTVEPLNNLNIARFAQMTQKTNQFNLTTQRYTEADITNLAENGALIYGLRAKDRFGDNGFTGLIIIKINDKKAEIDTLLLSCRILGKNIEDAFFQHILIKLKTFGIQSVKATYIKTQKNSQVEMFYEKFGFKIDKFSEMQKDYFLDLKNINYSISETYKLIEK